MTHRQHRLRARLDPAHRPAESARGPRDHDVLRLAAVAALRAEPAADIRRDGAHGAGLQTERALDHVLRTGGSLRADPDGAAAVGAPDGGAGPRLQWTGMKPRVSQRELLDHIAGVERIDFERWHRPLERDVAARVRVEKDVTAQRIVEIDHGWQSLGLDHDGFSRIDCLRARSRRARPLPPPRRIARHRAPSSGGPSPCSPSVAAAAAPTRR